MDVFQIVEEFNWVNNVLISSQTYEHIKNCNSLFNNFINKWRFEMTEDLKITLSNDFRVNYKEQSEKIEKNGDIM
jgi:ribosome-associated toxin RatA of RatAB toxin-antitoxin module